MLAVIAQANGAEMTLGELADLAGINRANIGAAVKSAAKAGVIQIGDRMRKGRMQTVINPSELLADDTLPARMYNWAIPAEVVPSIDQLVDAGFSAQKIATHLGVSRGTIRHVLHRSGAYSNIPRSNQ